MVAFWSKSTDKVTEYCAGLVLWSVSERSYAMVITLSADKRRSLSHFVPRTVCSFRLAFTLGLKILEAENKPTVRTNEIKAY